MPVPLAVLFGWGTATQCSPDSEAQQLQTLLVLVLLQPSGG